MTGFHEHISPELLLACVQHNLSSKRGHMIYDLKRKNISMAAFLAVVEKCS